THPEPIMPLSLSPNSLHPSTLAFAQIFSQNSNLTQPWLPHVLLRKRPVTQISCVSTRPKRKPGTKTEDPDVREMVRMLMRSFSDKQPLLKTLNKYVRIVRTEHCFLLFEELGKSDEWLHDYDWMKGSFTYITHTQVFRWMQKQRWYVADNGVYSKLISVMGKKGQTRMAMWLFSEMRNSGCRPDTSVYNALISAHLNSKDKAKALDKALRYFDKMKGMERCQPNIVTYNILLRAFAQSRNVEKVNSLFKDLDESIASADIYTYNGVMDAYGKNGNIREMESVFKSLVRSKEKPTLPTFNSMIINYGKARLKEKAEDVFKKMIDMKYTPSFITYESLIMMYGFCDSVSKAREVFDRLADSGKELKVSTLNAMLDVYCMNGLPVEADKLFVNGNSIGVRPNVSTYKLLYKAYTKANMKELLEKLLKCMDKDGIVPNKRFFLEALGAFFSSPGSPGSVTATT
ncbi:Tetratricopeptide repeat-like superfamily protein, partial [Prunus dulcis]